MRNSTDIPMCDTAYPANSASLPPPPPLSTEKSDRKMPEVPLKDIVIVLFMLGLWLYSIVMIMRAWSKIHNIPGAAAPVEQQSNIGGSMWKFVLDYIQKRKKTNAVMDKLKTKKMKKEEEHEPDSLSAIEKGSPVLQYAALSERNDKLNKLEMEHITIELHQADSLTSLNSLSRPKTFDEGLLKCSIYCDETTSSQLLNQQNQIQHPSLTESSIETVM